jgi:recombination protein RecA
VPVDPGKYEEAAAAIRKRYGQSAVSAANNSPSVARIPTGSIELDYATGGGVPIGRFSRFYGGYSSGKSLACWNVIKNAQQEGLLCAYYDAEKQFDPNFVKRLGVDIEKLIIVQGSIIEDICLKMEALMGSVHLHVIDSASQCISIHEMEADLEKERMGGSARYWSAGLKRVSEHMEASPDGNTVIIVDQVRDVFGMPGANPKPPGGRFIEHLSSMSLFFRRGTWLYRDPEGILTDDSQKKVTLSGMSEADGIETQIRVEKSRVCRPFRSARVRIDFRDMQYDLGFELSKAAVFFGIVERNGAWFTVPSGEKYQGEKKLRQAILEDKDLQAQIRKAVFDVE